MCERVPAEVRVQLWGVHFLLPCRGRLSLFLLELQACLGSVQMTDMPPHPAFLRRLQRLESVRQACVNKPFYPLSHPACPGERVFTAEGRVRGWAPLGILA